MLVLVVLILASPASIAGGMDMLLAASATVSPLHINCSETAGRYTTNGTFRSNLQALGAALVAEANATATGFASKRVGVAPDAAYGLVHCQADYAGPSCASDLAAAFQLVTSSLCPSYRDVTAYFGEYMLRFSGDDFLSTLSNEPECSLWNMNSVQGGEAAGLLAERVMELMNATANRAAVSSSRYATGEVSVGEQGVENVYGLVQRTPDLTGDQCRSCIVNISSKIPCNVVGCLAAHH